MPPIRAAKRFIKKVARGANHYKNTLIDPSPKLLVLVFHRIVPEIASDPLGVILSEKKFIQQLDALAKKYPVISLSDAVCQAGGGRAKVGCQVVLTFDDGYRDNYEVAFPILRKMGMPATFFIATDYMDSSAPLWDLSLISMLLCNAIDDVRIADDVVRKRPVESRNSFAFRVFERIKSLEPEKRRLAIDTLHARVKSDGLMLPPSANRCLTWGEARTMSDAGMEFGSHGMSHTSLARVAADIARKEIVASKDVIERNLHKPCDHFSFPFGSRRDYNDGLIQSVREAGYKACLLNVHGYNRFDKGCFSLKRIIMDESTDVRHIFG